MRTDNNSPSVEVGTSRLLASGLKGLLLNLLSLKLDGRSDLLGLLAHGGDVEGTREEGGRAVGHRWRVCGRGWGDGMEVQLVRPQSQTSNSLPAGYADVRRRRGGKASTFVGGSLQTGRGGGRERGPFGLPARKLVTLRLRLTGVSSASPGRAASGRRSMSANVGCRPPASPTVSTTQSISSHSPPFLISSFTTLVQRPRSGFFVSHRYHVRSGQRQAPRFLNRGRRKRLSSPVRSGRPCAPASSIAWVKRSAASGNDFAATI